MNLPPPPYDEPSAPPEDTKSPIITYPNSNPPLMYQTSAPVPPYFMNAPFPPNMPISSPRPMNPYPPPPPSQVYPMMPYGVPSPPMPYIMPGPQQQQMIVVSNGARNSNAFVRTSSIFKCGYVMKLGGAFGGSWQRRFFCIQPGAVLNYYEDGDSISGRGINFKGLLLLSGAIIEPVLQPVSGRNFCIRIKQTKSGTIDSGPKERWLSCNNQGEVNEWLYHLNLSKSSVPV